MENDGQPPALIGTMRSELVDRSLATLLSLFVQGGEKGATANWPDSLGALKFDQVGQTADWAHCASRRHRRPTVALRSLWRSRFRSPF